MSPSSMLARRTANSVGPYAWAIASSTRLSRIPTLILSPYSTGGKVNHNYADHVSILKFIERNWNLPTISGRSRDNLPNPTASGSAYVPGNSPAISDLFDLFEFKGHDE